ncbi:hypothetical protein [Chitinimonas naiadis]
MIIDPPWVWLGLMRSVPNYFYPEFMPGLPVEEVSPPRGAISHVCSVITKPVDRFD